MTGQKRQALKRLVDAKIREQVSTWNMRGCIECGGEYNSRTLGCKTCIDRHNRRKVYT